MTIEASASTRGEGAYRRLRDELLSGELLPGAKLRINEIADRYGVSPSVLREALARLASQGLVLSKPQRGYTVPELSAEALLDLTRARRLIETAALRESIADGDLTWESAVLAAQHRLARTEMLGLDGHVTREWSQAHNDFHHTLLSGGRSARLTEIADGLRDCSDLYIHWSRELVRGGEDRDVAAEHAEIADATLAREVERATDALAAHIERTTTLLLEYAESHTRH